VPPPETQPTKDECYRCGYDLRGFTDDQACPECGLLAQRSRRFTDELHNTRPRWLRTLSIGITSILLAIFAPIIGPLIVLSSLDELLPRLGVHVYFVGFDLSALLVLFGVLCLTRPEGYPPADQADRSLRIMLRCASLVLLLFATFAHLEIFFISSAGFFWSASILLSLLSIPLPLLLFLHLRGLARRARSAHLAEHCKIVGIGASASILYIIAVIFFLNHATSLGLDQYWTDRSNIALLLQTLLGVAATLFILWSLYLLLRFAIAFHIAARQLKHKWTRDDRSLSPIRDMNS
jgi:MFS family permease